VPLEKHETQIGKGNLSDLLGYRGQDFLGRLLRQVKPTKWPAQFRGRYVQLLIVKIARILQRKQSSQASISKIDRRIGLFGSRFMESGKRRRPSDAVTNQESVWTHRIINVNRCNSGKLTPDRVVEPALIFDEFGPRGVFAKRLQHQLLKELRLLHYLPQHELAKKVRHFARAVQYFHRPCSTTTKGSLEPRQSGVAHIVTHDDQYARRIGSSPHRPNLRNETLRRFQRFSGHPELTLQESSHGQTWPSHHPSLQS
jgi:hypothetical protein